jgi:hypothetical protein
VSLFDVIRYPVSDFTCQEEMQAIPAEIVLPWAKDCVGYLGQETVEDLSKFSSYAVGLLVYKYVLVASKARYDTLDENFINICKYYFLMMLKARIRDA